MEMSEKTYKSIRNAAAGNLVLGILTVIAGVSIGTLMIISGARLLRNRKNFMI